jgi:hypothetical protein
MLPSMNDTPVKEGFYEGSSIRGRVGGTITVGWSAKVTEATTSPVPLLAIPNQRSLRRAGVAPNRPAGERRLGIVSESIDSSGNDGVHAFGADHDNIAGWHSHFLSERPIYTGVATSD